MGTQHLTQERKIWNIDGTANKAGMISEFIDLHVQTKGRTEQMRFLITDLGTEDLILGYPWLAIFEPKFKWRDASINVKYCYVLVERSARLELDGYGSVIWHVVLEASASGTR